MATKKASGSRRDSQLAKANRATAKKKSAAKKPAAPRSMPKAGKDPKGGLTAAGRRFFNETEGAHLRPGVQGAADTPEKMMRKGSFLRRHFAHPRGPMMNDKGEPTRLALSAHAWGEPVPQTMSDAKKLANEGHELLEQYHAAREGRKQAAKRVAGKRPASKGPARTAGQRAGARTSRKGLVTKAPLPKAGVARPAQAKKVAAKKAPAKKAVTKKAQAKKAASQRSKAATRQSAMPGRRSRPGEKA